MKKLKWTVEFWPNVVYKGIKAHDEEEALRVALDKNIDNWPGLSEVTSNGAEFKVWVREEAVGDD